MRAARRNAMRAQVRPLLLAIAAFRERRTPSYKGK